MSKPKPHDDNFISLANRFEVLQQLPENGTHFYSSDARGVKTQTKLALINGRTQVQISKKNTVKRSDTEKIDIVGSYINTSNSYPDHQTRDKSQAMLYTNITAPNSPVLEHLHHIHDLPVECDNLDLSPAVQTQCPPVDGFTREEVVPLYIWNNKNASKDYKACVQQNGNQFGYITLNDLKTYQGPEVIWKQIPPIIQAHKLIRQSGVPNFLNCRIPVRT